MSMWIEEVKKLNEEGNEIITGYKYVKRYYHNKLGKNKTVSKTYKVNSRQAYNKAETFLSKRIEAINNEVNSSKITFSEVYTQYFNFKKIRWANATIVSAKGTYNNHIKPYDFKDYLLTAIELKDVQKLLDTVQYEKGLSKRSTDAVKNLIVSVMNFAKMEYNFITHLDFRLLEIKEKEPSHFEGFIDSEILNEEIAKMRLMLNDIEADLMEFQILTGMRYGEATAITEADWLVAENQISINKSIDSSNRRQVKETKNRSSYRIIDSSKRVNEIMEKRISHNKRLYRDKSNFIFVTRNNLPVAHSNLNKKLKKVNKHYSSHVMRHTHISLLSEKEFPLKYIMQRVGHTNPETTLRIYTHVTQKIKNRGIKKLDNLF